jgi:threonine synthase
VTLNLFLNLFREAGIIHADLVVCNLTGHGLKQSHDLTRLPRQFTNKRTFEASFVSVLPNLSTDILLCRR